jgi:cytochrome c oxidase assembly factor CtaG
VLATAVATPGFWDWSLDPPLELRGADQQIAAGIMWVPGSVSFLIVMFVYVHSWLSPTEPGSGRAGRLASEH